MNKFISIRICIYKIVFLLLKYFSLKIFIFQSVLCLQNKHKYFWIALYHVFKCSLTAENESPCISMFVFLRACVMSRLEMINFIYFQTIKTPLGYWDWGRYTKHTETEKSEAGVPYCFLYVHKGRYLVLFLSGRQFF